jgi:general secretion pathway protein H
MSRSVPIPSQAGFTLIEVLVALAILSVGAILALPLTRNATTAQAMRVTAAEIADAGRLTRAAAVIAGAERVLLVDTTTRTFRSEGVVPARAVPAHVGIDVAVPPGERAGNIARIRFMADGGSSGGTLVLRDGARTATISFDWMTGAASVSAP